MMRKSFLTFLVGFGVLLPIFGMATWQITNPYHGPAFKRHIFSPAHGKTDYPHAYYNNKHYLAYLRRGSLRSNIERIAQKNHWRVNWKVNHLYYVTYHHAVAGPDFPTVMNRILQYYPLRASYNDTRRMMTVWRVKKRRSWIKRKHRRLWSKVAEQSKRFSLVK